MYSFSFLGKDCYKDFGIMITERPSIFKPQRNIDYIDIPGRSGSLKIDHKTYNDIVIPIECWFTDDIKNNIFIPEIADNIKNWLNSGEGDLVFSNQPDKKYIAHVSDQIEIDQELKVLGKFLVNFRCKPFKKAVDESKYIILDNCISRSGSVINPLQTYNFVGGTAAGNDVPVRMYPIQPVIIENNGTVESEPIITIYGTGNVSVTLNGNAFSINNVEDYVTIDSQMQDAYKDTQLKNNDMTGEFPILQCGENILTWTGNVSKIEVNFNAQWI